MKFAGFFFLLLTKTKTGKNLYYYIDKVRVFNFYCKKNDVQFI